MDDGRFCSIHRLGATLVLVAASTLAAPTAQSSIATEVESRAKAILSQLQTSGDAAGFREASDAGSP